MDKVPFACLWQAGQGVAAPRLITPPFLHASPRLAMWAEDIWIMPQSAEGAARPAIEAARRQPAHYGRCGIYTIILSQAKI
jgi:hypothetical protein